MIKAQRPQLFNISILLMVSGILSLVGCTDNNSQPIRKADNVKSIENTTEKTIDNTFSKASNRVPATRFDMSHWKLTLPTDSDLDGKVDDITNEELQNYVHDNFFYVDELGHLVFTAPNKGGTTKNSHNTRSELRYLSANDPSVNSHDPRNNFAIASHPNADQFAAIGGKMEVTMHVDHAPRNSNKPNQSSSYAAVIGQIHAIKYKERPVDGFGYGNEPLKIMYKKWPNHKTGSIYWNYERNLAKDNPDRTDISYVVWGNSRKDPADPGEQGIALGEDFSYTVNVYKDTMYLTFENPRLGKVHHQINLSNNVDANGVIDTKDNPQGYIGDGNYFKAGVYNQCRAVPKKGETEGRCPGTGDWAIDKANGDYAQVSFSKLLVSGADAKKSSAFKQSQ